MNSVCRDFLGLTTKRVESLERQCLAEAELEIETFSAHSLVMLSLIFSVYLSIQAISVEL